MAGWYDNQSSAHEPRRARALAWCARAACVALLALVAVPVVSYAVGNVKGDSTFAEETAHPVLSAPDAAQAPANDAPDASQAPAKPANDAPEGVVMSDMPAPQAPPELPVDNQLAPAPANGGPQAPSDAVPLSGGAPKDEGRANAVNDTDPNAGSGFAWKFADDEQNPGCCKIVDWNLTSPSTGRIYVPAVAPADAGACAGKPVTRIAKTGGSKALNITGTLDFTYATNLKRIENYQFQQCINIAGVVNLPQNLEFLGDAAFLGCIQLGSLTFAPDARLQEIPYRAFDDCAISGTVEIPKSVTKIGDYAFRHSGRYGGNNRIDTLVIPQGSQLQQVGKNAFYQNNISNDLVFPASTSSFGAYAFANNKIPGVFLSKTTGSMQVYDSAFAQNQITNDPISGVQFSSLGKSAFAYNDITARPIDDAGTYDHTVDFTSCSFYMKSPSERLIENNPSIERVVISQSWGFVPNYFLANNKNITEVVLPEVSGDNGTLHRIGEGAFQNCTGLTSFDFGNTNLRDDSYAGGNKAIGPHAFQGCSNLESVSLGQGAYTHQGDQPISVSTDTEAFKDCSKLSYVGLPGSISQKSITVNVGDRAFMNTNLGAFYDPSDPQKKPIGVLPLGQRNVGTIGTSAFENSGLAAVTLPSTLTSIGDRAFAGNHMSYLKLPADPNLDGHVGTGNGGILADQDLTGKGTAYFGLGDPAAGKTSVMLDTLTQAFHLPAKDVIAPVSMTLPGGSSATGAIDQSNTKAAFDLAAIPQGSTLSYGFNVYREGSSAPLSTGSAKGVALEEGRPMEFHYYTDYDPAAPNHHYSGNDGLVGDDYNYFSHVQWTAPGGVPDAAPGGVSNFGVNRPGYHTQQGSYVGDPAPEGSVANAGWVWEAGTLSYPGVSVKPGDPVDPAATPSDATASNYVVPVFANRWIPNTYSVTFDDSWDVMVQQDAQLGKDVPVDPADPDGAKHTVRDEQWVSGSTDDMTGLAYGEATTLSPCGFKMGGYAFDGWATSPLVDEAARVVGTNYFPAGSSIATPSPAPADGGSITLYAQWKSVDMGGDVPALMGFLDIPQHINLKPYQNKLYSVDPNADAATDPSNHDVVLQAAPELPGQTWPADKIYAVSVDPPQQTQGAPLLEISALGDPDPKVIQVLDPDGQPYDPLQGALVTIDPHGQKSGTFSLESLDPVTAFGVNLRYAGSLTFKVDIVQKEAVQ